MVGISAVVLVAAACGDDDAPAPAPPVTVIVEVPGETVTVEVEVPGETVTEIVEVEVQPEPMEVIDVNFVGLARGFNLLYNTVMKEKGIDVKHGFNVDILDTSQIGDALVALRSGDADIGSSGIFDFLRQQQAGLDATAFNFAYNFGNPILVPSDSPYETLDDLRGLKIGVLDPNEVGALTFRAVSNKLFGFDLAEEAELVGAAPFLLLEFLDSGDFDATFTFGSFAFPRVKDGSLREIMTTPGALAELGIEVPLVVWMVTDDWREEHGDEGVLRFKAMLDEVLINMLIDDAGWEVYADSAGVALRDRREFIDTFRTYLRPIWGPEVVAAIQEFTDAMLELVDAEFVGVETVDPDAFFFGS